MKKILLIAAVCAALTLCSCEQKNSSLTESQTETTTKATSLTIASQSATSTATTTAATTEKTEFTSRDAYHTQAEERQEIKDFCGFVCRKWTAMYNGGQSFDFTPYCKYENLAKYLELETKASVKSTLFSDAPSAHLMELSYSNNDGIIFYTADYVYSTGVNGRFTFIVQSTGGKFKLCDMIYDAQESYDVKYRNEQLKKTDIDYWALCDYDALVKRIQAEQTKP